MKLPLFSNGVPKHKDFLTLDIGTDYVKCLSFEYTEDPEPKLSISGMGKQPLGYLYTRAGAIVDYEGVKQVTEVAVKEAISSSGTKTREVILGLSGETTKGLVTTVRLVRPEPERKVSTEELSRIISKIEETALAEAMREVAVMTGNADIEIALINSALSFVKVDGVYIKEPLGATGRVLEIALFTAFCPEFHLDLLQKLTRDLKLKMLTVTSQLYALSKLLSEKKEDANMVIMDVGGETTDVGVVFGGGLVATRTLSMGGRHVTRVISEAFGMSFGDAEEKKIRYSLGNLDQEESFKIKECVGEVADLWLSGVELLFSDFDGVKTFPSKIFLVGGGALLGDILEKLNKEPWTRSIAFKEPPTFEKVAFSDLHGIHDLTGKITGLDDILPAAIAEVYLEL
ncbi:pilus assembly protein PilM [candidate division WWE3 bacterium]|nr:pilus assembly protein PilM [candidate division WWE3 bacterium]